MFWNGFYFTLGALAAVFAVWLVLAVSIRSYIWAAPKLARWWARSQLKKWWNDNAELSPF